MGYTLNSAKDSQGNEQLFMELFNRQRPQIEAYKQQHGGDLEGAFGTVTGTPWPSGRSVKISHGQPEMTKDRTVKSVLGKYVALPAALAATAAFAPGAIPALAHAVGGSAMAGGGGALAGRAAMGAIPGILKGDWKQALLGAGTGAITPGGFGGGAAQGGKAAAGSVMKSLLTKTATGALQGGMQDGWKGALTGAAGGATSAIPGNVGKILNATGQSNIGGDIMSSILNHGSNQDTQVTPNQGFGQDALAQQQQVQGRTRPQGW